uniref:Ig-like domain-containing protein n=1 Tax=Periophthalmus magnuspinnatus TaxID=409849 RepID=A0A3B4AZP1_9GOBI
YISHKKTSVFLTTKLQGICTCYTLFESLGNLEFSFGDNIKLSCISSDNVKIGARFSWQNPGQIPTLLSTLYSFDKKSMFYDEFSDKSRLSLTSDNNLTISDLQVNDTAMYYCASSKLYKLNFAEAIHVVVKGIDSYIESEIHQSPREDVKPNQNSVILNCSVQAESCEGEHRVHWFKQFEESVAGVVYSYGGRGDRCESNQDSPTNSLVYNLPVHNVSSEKTGTYSTFTSMQTEKIPSFL